MTKIEFEGTGKACYFPDSWDELRPGDIQAMYRDLEAVHRGRLSMEQLLLREVQRLLGLKRFSVKSLSADAVANLTTLTQLLSFAVTPDGWGLTFDGLQNPLPVLSTAGRKFFGPGEGCMDLTFGAYRNAAQAANAFFTSGDTADMNECIAHLYRPAAKMADKAGRFVKAVAPESFASDLAAVARIPEWQRRLILSWFCHCIGHLQSGTIRISGEEVDMAALFSGADKGKGPENTMNDLLIQIAKEGSIGNMDAVDASPLPVILMHMWSNFKENKRYELQLQKARSARSA